jgi:predicted nucleic-acid-binding protein
MARGSREIWLIDTNVLVYFLNEQSNHHTQAASALKLCEERGATQVVAQQNLLELIHVLRDGYGLEQTVVLAKIEILVSKRVQIITPKQKTWEKVRQLLKQSAFGGKSDLFDLFLQATAMGNNVTGVLTADKSGFIALPDFKVKSLGS